MFERQMVERELQPGCELFLRQHVMGGRVAAALEIAVRRDVLIERHLVRLMAAPPGAMSIARLVDGDAVDPRPQARLASEPVNRPKDPEEDFLGKVEGLLAVAEQVQRKLDDHALVLGHQLREGRIVVGGAPLHERRFTAAYVRPAGNACLFHREFHYTNIRHRPRPKVPTRW